MSTVPNQYQLIGGSFCNSEVVQCDLHSLPDNSKVGALQKSQHRVISRQIELSKATGYCCWSSYGVGRLSICQCSGMVEAEEEPIRYKDDFDIFVRLAVRANERSSTLMDSGPSVTNTVNGSRSFFAIYLFGIVLLQRYHYSFLLVRS